MHFMSSRIRVAFTCLSQRVTWSGLVGNQRQIGFDFAISAVKSLSRAPLTTCRFFLKNGNARNCCVLETLRDPDKFLLPWRKQS